MQVAMGSQTGLAAALGVGLEVEWMEYWNDKEEPSIGLTVAILYSNEVCERLHGV